jgi:hypothetical protein
MRMHAALLVCVTATLRSSACVCARLHTARQPTFPVLKALRTTVVYSLGSIAIGSFIIAVIQFVRVRGGPLAPAYKRARRCPCAIALGIDTAC